MRHVKKHLLLATIIGAMAPGIASADESLLKASDMLNSNVSNGINVIGGVTDVILDENSESIEYVLLEVSETFNPNESGERFAEISNVVFRPVAETGEWEVVIEDTDAQRKPEELTLNRQEADHRLLSNVLDSSVQFAGDEALEIEDLLINTDNGDISYFTVAMNNDSFFNKELRAVPTSEIEISMKGHISTSTPLRDLDSSNKYELGSL